MKYLYFFVLLFIAFVCKGQPGSAYTELNLDSIFREPGTFVLYDYQRDHYEIYNPAMAEKEYAVHSTSKIFWAIIGLEEGFIQGGNDITPWDSIRYPRQDGWPNGWTQDQSVISALGYSVNWYFIELLKKMTPEMIEKYLNRLDYKAGYKVEGVHYFGLTNTIKKSAMAQVDFLKRLYFNDAKLASETLGIIKQGLLRRQTSEYVLYSKTGLGPVDNNNGIGWYIGFVEKGDDLYFFALNVIHPDEMMAAKLRIDYGKRVLNAMKIINGDFLRQKVE